MNANVKNHVSQGIVKSSNVTAYRKARATKGRPKGSQNLARKGRNVTEPRRRIRFKVLTHEDLSEGPPPPPAEITYSDNTNTDGTRRSSAHETSEGAYSTRAAAHARSKSHMNHGHAAASTDSTRWTAPHSMRPASEPPLRNDGFMRSQDSSHQTFDGNYFNYVGAFSNSFPFFSRCEGMPPQEQPPHHPHPPQHPAIAPEIFSPPEWDQFWSNPGFQVGWWPIDQTFEGQHPEHNGDYTTHSATRSPSSGPSSSREERQGSAATDLTGYSDAQSIPANLDGVHGGGDRFMCPPFSSATDGMSNAQVSQPLSMDGYHHPLADTHDGTGKLDGTRTNYNDNHLKSFSMDRFLGQSQARPMQESFPI